MNKMRLPSRIIIALASLALTATYFLPVWFIFLIAPQYPEGLTMNIWLNRITGQVDIINGLNHYIGMKHIKADMFPEFSFLVYIVGFFIMAGLVVAWSGRRKFLFAYLLLSAAGGLAALCDFYKWGYDYGHHLDPKAAIQIPGLYYQPPLIGHKTLLNFDAYSYPDSGGWVIIGIALTFLLVYGYEWKRSRKARGSMTSLPNKTVPVAATLLIFLLSSCSTEPAPFAYGKDLCEDCKMTIMDPRSGAEIITKKGRVYKFDDAHCIAHFLSSGKIKPGDIAQTVFIDYENNKNFLDAKDLFFVVSPRFKTPMNSHAAAFSSRAKAAQTAAETQGEVKTWEQLKKEPLINEAAIAHIILLFLSANACQYHCSG
jgi:copper chaperone NosL